MKRSALILVFNSKGELALQLRSAEDDGYPSCWDFSAGGGVRPDEDPENTAVRETEEELGIRSPVQFLKTVHYAAPSQNRDGEVFERELFLFETLHDGPFDFDPREVEAVEFFSIDTIRRMIDTEKEKFHPRLLFFFENHRDMFQK